jgi:predicted DNA-binding transcriptional regulator AlpA
MKNNTAKLIPTREYHASPRLTHEFKSELKRNIKWLFVNKEFVEFIESTIKKLPQKDKLACLYYFKKLAVQVRRTPEPEHYKAHQDIYDEEISQIGDEQKFYEPVKWINAEIEYITSAMEHLTTEDVDRRLDIMQDAKQRLSKDWLTKEDVMTLFGISQSTLSRRIAEGMPVHKKGKALHFYLPEISAWMKDERAA